MFPAKEVPHLLAPTNKKRINEGDVNPAERRNGGMEAVWSDKGEGEGSTETEETDSVMPLSPVFISTSPPTHTTKWADCSGPYYDQICCLFKRLIRPIITF